MADIVELVKKAYAEHRWLQFGYTNEQGMRSRMQFCPLCEPVENSKGNEVTIGPSRTLWHENPMHKTHGTSTLIPQRMENPELTDEVLPCPPAIGNKPAGYLVRPPAKDEKPGIYQAWKGEYIEANKYTPAVIEIMEAVGWQHLVW